MALETGTYISDLVSTNPVGTDFLDKADDHIRLIKSTVKATFPNISGAVSATHTELNAVQGMVSQSGSGFLRNRIINGDMRIDQRNAGASVSSGIGAITYTADRWSVATAGAAVTAQRLGTWGAQYLQISGAASVTACVLRQRIEGMNIADLAGSSVVLSFVCSSTTLASISAALSYANSADNFTTVTSIASQTVSITSSGARYSVSFTLPSGAANGVEVSFSLGAFTSGTFAITNVQLEAGSTATAFERRQYGHELALCQRYFWLLGKGSSQPWGCGALSGSGSSYATIPLPVTMRAGPSLTVSGTGFSAQDNSLGPVTPTISLSVATPQSVFVSYTHAALTSNAARHLITTDSTSHLQFSAEL